MQVFIARQILNSLPSCWERAPECFKPTTRFPVKQQYIDELVELGLLCCDETYNDGVKMYVRTELGDDFFRVLRKADYRIPVNPSGEPEPDLMDGVIPEDSELCDAVRLFKQFRAERAKMAREWYDSVFVIEHDDSMTDLLALTSVSTTELRLNKILKQIEKLLQKKCDCLNRPNVSVGDFCVTDDEEE